MELVDEGRPRTRRTQEGKCAIIAAVEREMQRRPAY